MHLLHPLFLPSCPLPPFLRDSSFWFMAGVRWHHAERAHASALRSLRNAAWHRVRKIASMDRMLRTGRRKAEERRRLTTLQTPPGGVL